MQCLQRLQRLQCVRAPEWMTKALRQPNQFGRATPAPLSESGLASSDLNEVLSRSVGRLRRAPGAVIDLHVGVQAVPLNVVTFD